MTKGTRVKMTEQCKKDLLKNCTKEKHVGPFSGDNDCYGYDCYGCSLGHVEEFGDCVGIVGKTLEYDDIEVRWQPSNLLYHYFPSQLEIVEE